MSDSKTPANMDKLNPKSKSLADIMGLAAPKQERKRSKWHLIAERVKRESYIEHYISKIQTGSPEDLEMAGYEEVSKVKLNAQQSAKKHGLDTLIRDSISSPGHWAVYLVPRGALDEASEAV